jgi:hypothetical protein
MKKLNKFGVLLIAGLFAITGVSLFATTNNVPKISGVVVADTANTASTIVSRDTDNSINVGKANCSFIASSGGRSIGVHAYTTAGTLDSTTSVAYCDATAASFALNLPSATLSTGLEYHVVKTTAANTVTLTAVGGDNIISSGSVATTTAMTTRGTYLILTCDGFAWYQK